MRRFLSLLFVVLLFPLVALAAQATIPDPSQLEAFATFALNAVQSGNYSLVAALGVIAAVYALRRFGGGRIPFLATDRGGALLVIITSVAGALATAFAAGTAVSLPLVISALVVALKAAGGFSLAKKLLFGDKSIAQAEDAGAKAAAEVGGKAAAVAALGELK
jgi:hypothetical protein